MNIDRLRYVEAAVRLSSLTEASREVSVTSQAVSNAVNEMEGLYGRDLFDRVGRGLVTTEFGRQFAEKAREAIDAWDAVMDP